MDGKSQVFAMTLFGVAAALLALLSPAPAASSFLQDAPPGPPATIAPVAQDARKPEANAPKASRVLQLVAAYFGCAPNAVAAEPASCPVDTLIATVPDPAASTLDWAFDQQLDALRRAHEAAGFVVDGFWLPWQTGAVAADPVLATEEPGVMLFRRGSVRELRVLFLVGEVPTSGIHKRALAAALRDRDALLSLVRSPDDRPAAALHVVGPAFSGSAPSLRAVLDDWLDGDAARTAEVVSGSATAAGNTTVLTRRDGAAVRLRYRSTVHTDETLLAVFADHVLPGLGLLPHEVAILQESSTQYGASVRDAPAATNAAGKYLLLPFPMNVSVLRGAYARTWKEGKATGPPQMFELDLESRDHLGELPRPVSKLSPAVIDLMLAEVCRVLAEQRIRVLVLFGTDVRDKVFLGREVARRLPDVQLVTTESNVLHARSELADAQRGMLVLSTYPLFATAGAWPAGAGDARQRLLFATEGAQGVHNAALVQLGLPRAVVDYALPTFGEDTVSRPPVWLTCVGRTRLLPVAVHVPAPGDEDCPLGIDDAVARTERLAKPVSFVGLLLTVTLGIAILCAGVAMLLRASRGLRRHAVYSYAKTKRADPGSEFAELLQIAYTLHGEIYRAIQMTVLTALFLPHGALLWIVARTVGATVGWERVHALAGVAIVLFGAACAVIGWTRVVRIAARYAKRGLAFVPAGCGFGARCLWLLEILLRGSVAVIGVMCFAGWIVYSFAAASLADDRQHAEPFFQRAALVDEGVSPLLPLFLIGVGVVAWCGWHLRRARLLKVRVPFEAGELALAGMFGQERTAAAVRLSLTHLVPEPRGFVLGAALLVVAVYLFDHGDRTLEHLVLGAPAMGGAFDLLFFPGLIGLLLATVWGAYRLIVVWRRTEALLEVNAGARSTAACKRIVATYGVSMNLGLWVPLPRTDLQPAIARAWRRLESARGDRTLIVAGDVRTAVEPMPEVPDSPTPLARERLILSLRDVVPAVAAADDRVLGKPAAGSPEANARAWLENAHDVMALELLAWLRWTFGHVRTLAFFLVLSLLVSTLLLWSYPFHPQHLLRSAFLVVSVGVVAVLTTVITSMNRNKVASVLAGSVPGQVTWDRGFVTNVLTFSLLPLLTTISAQMPAFAAPLLGWLEPALKSLMQAG